MVTVSRNNGDKGFLRSTLRAPDFSVSDVFKHIDSLPNVTSIIRNEKRGLTAGRVVVDKKDGSGYWDFLKIRDDFIVVICDFNYIEPRMERVPGNELLQFHIKLSGQLTLSTSADSQISVEGPALLVWRQPEGVELNEWTEDLVEEKSITVYCKPSFILDRLFTDTKDMSISLKDILSDNQKNVTFCNLPLSADILECTREIIDAKYHYKNQLWLSYAEAKSLELICLLISNFDRLSEKISPTFSEADLAGFYKARDIFSSQFNPPPSISSVAKTIGMNQTKLKQGFKTLFHVTIFEFRNQCRMRYSLNLLQKNLPISVVASKVGYKHSSTFSTAFKFFFNFRPKDAGKLKATGYM